MATQESTVQNKLSQIDSTQTTKLLSTEGLNPYQQKYLETFINSYTKRTITSKQLTQACRQVLADPRASDGFNLMMKEICYPIVGKRSLGSKIWDIDGNEYIDLMMGFGVNLFGHNPSFIKEALTEQLEKGIQIGPQSEFAGEVAELISELTGMERVAFSNTGTEAVMTAIRLARATTDRNKIVIFSGSYHGHFDGTLVKAQSVDDENLRAVPIAPGVPPNIVKDVLVLDYGNPQSLEAIKAHEQELAAVLVVPVQNSRPDLQPKTFLQQLRKLTKELGIILIFDEMVTGFRIHPGGAQAYFGVEADIATYGKIIGGGLPIGVIAGKAAYMDAIDGGIWSYGDSSYPQAKTTFFAGTFCKHPLAMAAARAVLRHLKTQGPALQEQLNQRTSQFIQALNTYFEEDEVPIRMANFGSLFGTASSRNSEEAGNSAISQTMNLLIYHLFDKGILLFNGTGYLCTAHTDEDIDCIIQAVKDSVRELRDGGFLPTSSDKLAET
ncbi:aspartate aminotransferase family protein [Brasilonema octagenarum UFV-E1]|uniref:Aspartate aminotransferase family protein n=2 Tax=Brasilonema TaxID=383614 RepID=A0A856MKY1_9CYAN|nr:MULTISPECIES: aspartate aminotransferase family protein [Brasilonema]NMF61947.1 aspartate aminotransferase family protein [Brasilonema octagenarum UFV-OR1]QDL10790.1 aspartate aminotransferase family protein [Brasilonema sennae CENA114]QDL17136.1 aspartate aminotransferase family protein [Brasilonema octagenarum UFV-E1]